MSCFRCSQMTRWPHFPSFHVELDVVLCCRHHGGRGGGGGRDECDAAQQAQLVAAEGGAGPGRPCALPGLLQEVRDAAAPRHALRACAHPRQDEARPMPHLRSVIISIPSFRPSAAVRTRCGCRAGPHPSAIPLVHRMGLMLSHTVTVSRDDVMGDRSAFTLTKRTCLPFT